MGILLTGKGRAMKAKWLIGLMVLLAWNGIAVADYPETRVYLLGDKDGIHYDGAGSVDDVYIDPAFAVYAKPGVGSTVPFDIVMDNRGVPFTFLFPLGSGESITGATLTLGLRAAPSGADNDWLVLHPDDGTMHWTYGATHWAGDHYTVYRYDELGWSVPDTGVTVFTVDLANIDGDNRLPWLQKGYLNIHITDDTAVDYAELTITVVPEPITLSLLALGGLAMIRRRRGW